MYNAFDADKAIEDKEFSNWIRLYCVVTKITPIKHINYCSSDFEGCFFSTRRKTPWWIESRNIDILLSSDNFLDDVKSIIKKEVGCYIRTPQNHNQLIIGWLTIKAIMATNKSILLNHWNERAVSAYLEISKNNIVPCDEFHWGNVFCGYSWRDGIYPAGIEENWNNCINLDSPITSISYIPKFHNRSDTCISNKDIEKYDNEINTFINSFWESDKEEI